MSDTVEIKHNDNAPDWALTTERIPVFSVVRDNPAYAEWVNDEHETEDQPPAKITRSYTMPAKPNPGLALEYLRKARVNTDIAASWLLELAIGTEGYDALSEELMNEPDPDVASATMQSVILFVSKRALGGLSGKA